MSDDKRPIKVDVDASGVLWIVVILFAVIMQTNKSCGGGIVYELDGQPHTFSWSAK